MFFFVSRRKYNKLLAAHLELHTRALEAEAAHKQLRDGFAAFMAEHGHKLIDLPPAPPKNSTAPTLMGKSPVADDTGNVFHLDTKRKPKK